MTKSFSVETLLKKIVKKTVVTILDPVVTMIKAERKGAASRQYNFCRNIKSWRLIDELCRDRIVFCHDKNDSDYNTSHLRQVFLCCDKVFSIKTAKGGISVTTKKILSRHDI